VANWKTHKTRAQALAFVHEFVQLIAAPRAPEIAIAPPFPLLEAVGRALHNTSIKLAAQNMHFAREGAFTGEVSPALLRELGVTYVILGHSERREHFRETDELIHKKILAAFDCDLIPVLCVGETLETRRAGGTPRFIESQLQVALKDLEASSIARCVIAYEPIWAIGTGVNAAPADAQAVARHIRQRIADWHNATVAKSLRILYGGSVKPENARELLIQPDIDGALVGGASLDPKAFAQIVRAAGAGD
jgi:triosephosphate isomerase